MNGQTAQAEQLDQEARATELASIKEALAKLKAEHEATIKERAEFAAAARPVAAPADGLVARAEAALAKFQAAFGAREARERAAVGELEAKLKDLQHEHDELMYAGEDTTDLEKQYVECEEQLNRAKSALSMVSQWRKREAGKIAGLEKGVIVAYRQELQDDFDRLQAHRGKIAAAKAAYIRLVGENLRMGHEIAGKIKEAFRDFGLFPTPGFRNMDAKDQEITLEDLHKGVGAPYSSQVLWAQIQTYGKQRLAERTAQVRHAQEGDEIDG